MDEKNATYFILPLAKINENYLKKKKKKKVKIVEAKQAESIFKNSFLS